MWQLGTYISAQQTTIFDVTNATDTSIGSGKSNTDLIIATQTRTGRPFAAAAIAVAYRGGGYSDWVLPSRAELRKLFYSRNEVGGYEDSWYWASTEINEWYASAMAFSSILIESELGGYKGPGGTPYKVRAIRYF
jgi:hypothetical protein